MVGQFIHRNFLTDLNILKQRDKAIVAKDAHDDTDFEQQNNDTQGPTRNSN